MPLFFANIYLNGFDHFVKEQLRVDQYLRYVDDFALFSDGQGFLADAHPALEDFLVTLRLKIHPIKSQLFQTRIAPTFVGFRVFPNHKICSGDGESPSENKTESDGLVGSPKTHPAHLQFLHLA
jgi:Reverse transcriptase (RNA-dependent DNA polymerase)